MAQQTGGNIVGAGSRSSPLALSPSDHAYEPNRGLLHDLPVRPQTVAWDGGPTKMLPSLAAPSLSPSHVHTDGRGGYGSYPTVGQALLPVADQVHLPTGTISEFNRSPLMFGDIDSGAAFLDMLLGLPGGQETGTTSANTEKLAIPWTENGTSHPLTISPPVEGGSRSYPAHICQNVKKVQNFWSTPQRLTAETQIWYEIISGSSDNIFSRHDYGPCTESPQQAQHAGHAEICLNHEIRSQLQNLKRSLLKRQCHCSSSDGQITDTCDEHYFCENFNGIFEQGLYLYLDKYQPTYPILHVPTFKPQTVHTLLLFTMCIIGLSFVKTEEAVRFIYHIYPALLDEVYIRVISTTPNVSKPSAMLSHLTLAHHMLFLLVVTEGNICPTKSQMLYGYTLTAAQNLGLFHLDVGQISASLFSTTTDDHIRWKLWSRIESIKNLIIGLILYDTSLAGIFSMSPVISTSTLHVALPCDFALYRAQSTHNWIALLQKGSNITTPTVKLSHNDFYLPTLPHQVHISCLYGIMSAILVRLTANYHRLIIGSDLSQADWHQHIPWRIYNLDKRATSITNVVIHFIQLYDTILAKSNPNCIVIWHNLCLLLTADIRLHERAAGREGPEAMQTARRAISLWAKTPAARRACLHAAQIFHTLSNWKPMDGMGFQPARCLLNSALVLALYTLVSPAGVTETRHTNTFDLATADIDWKVVGDEGMTDSVSGEGQPQQSRTDDPAVNFIRFGGPVVLCGKTYFGGASYARRLLLDFASLLDEVGRHWMAKYPRLLYMIHDTMVDVDIGGEMRDRTT
ncbi:hypothetical protein BDV27DRAFT_152714 [Aspergillus caelatus]|uniref:Xylanolytic transcriptional activator regulatory domain-containing protein n=1 Tax=Aspergillus caelatus TaxID=61420 RepID=A0A5N7AJB0_9EURO|nr:uncharacterized protein BDV27DRAFT_152714 [Aspergillus caelatus]KAE8369835.1 hypothetical protein BDV27DRAFT_152714 [Aspergillus caelatus]